MKRPTTKSVKSIESEEERSLWSPMFVTTIIVTMLGSAGALIIAPFSPAEF